MTSKTDRLLQIIQRSFKMFDMNVNPCRALSYIFALGVDENQWVGGRFWIFFKGLRCEMNTGLGDRGDVR